MATASSSPVYATPRVSPGTSPLTVNIPQPMQVSAQRTANVFAAPQMQPHPIPSVSVTSSSSPRLTRSFSSMYAAAGTSTPSSNSSPPVFSAPLSSQSVSVMPSSRYSPLQSAASAVFAAPQTAQHLTPQQQTFFQRHFQMRPTWQRIFGPPQPNFQQYVSPGVNLPQPQIVPVPVQPGRSNCCSILLKIISIVAGLCLGVLGLANVIPIATGLALGAVTIIGGLLISKFLCCC